MRLFVCIIIFINLLTLKPCYAETSRFFSEKAFSCASLAEAVNHYVNIGEDATVRELYQIAEGTSSTNGLPLNVPTDARIGAICRILFQQQRTETIRPPAYGWLSDLENIGLPSVFSPSSWTNISKNWPLYPVATSGSCYFVLSESYSFQGFGGPENPKDYVAFSRRHGVFRKILLHVPTRKEAMEAAANLRKSNEWKSIKWTDSGEGYAIRGNGGGMDFHSKASRVHSAPVKSMPVGVKSRPHDLIYSLRIT
jgi:hypothetical protein